MSKSWSSYTVSRFIIRFPSSFLVELEFKYLIVEVKCDLSESDKPFTNNLELFSEWSVFKNTSFSESNFSISEFTSTFPFPFTNNLGFSLSDMFTSSTMESSLRLTRFRIFDCPTTSVLVSDHDEYKFVEFNSECLNTKYFNNFP